MRTYKQAVSTGVFPIKDSSPFLNRTLSIAWEGGVKPSSGAISVQARPFGRTDFIPIDGASNLSVSSEHTITFSYPYDELRLICASIAGAATVIVSIQEAV